MYEFVFFFKQKTAYEMRISDWSSDVCSSDLSLVPLFGGRAPADWRKAIYYHYYEYPGFHSARAHYGMRNDRYKLARFYSDAINAWEFYDLKTDQHAMHNRIDDPAMQARIDAIKHRPIALPQQHGHNTR